MIRSHPLGALVTSTADGLDANHIPFLIHADPAPFGTLHGHIARANPLARAAYPGDALAIFQGPDHYISPSWYPTKQETGKVVPTWNYVIVHAHGPLRLIDDAAWLRAHLDALTNQHESGRAVPWRIADTPPGFVETLLPALIGVEIPIARLTGKWKVSQNRPPRDRDGVVAGLRAEATDNARAMATEVITSSPTDQRTR